MKINVQEALARAKKLRKLDKITKAQETEIRERVLELASGELGFDAAKVGVDDLIKLQFTGRIKQKDGGKIFVSVDNIIVPKEDNGDDETKIIPSPSA